MKENDEVQLRVYGDSDKPALIYLPGLHGDWTLIGGFRRALASRVRFFEITYPRTLTWTLDDYARHVESALAAQNCTEGWLLGESFSSQVVWALLQRNVFKAKGVVLAGGFVRHPARWGVGLAWKLAGQIPLRLITFILFGYAKTARLRFRHSPEVWTEIHEFISRRTEADRNAAVHRLELIFQNDPSAIARSTSLPLYVISGVLDPVVPWMFVRSWLRKNCPALREYRLIAGADHNVLGTAPGRSSDQILRWINRQ